MRPSIPVTRPRVRRNRPRAYTPVWRSSLFLLVAFAMAAVLLPTIAGAQSRNEVLINVLYDGSAPFDAGEPTAPTGSAPEVHVPSLDGGPQNLVVRTHDVFAVRVDWNVNEDDAANVVLEVVLPPEATWAPDATGMFAGCDPAASSFPSPQILLCSLEVQVEGSNGAIRPVALLNEALDASIFDVSATLTTAADPTGVNDGLDQFLTVSEGPFVDFVKAPPVKSELINNGTEDGFVLLYPLTVVDYSQGAPIIGVGPVNDSVPVSVFDHMWNLTPSVRLATQAEMDAAEVVTPNNFQGTPCGRYENFGTFVPGTDPSGGTVTCGAQVIGAGGYPVVPITISGVTSRPPAAMLADGSVNADPFQTSSGQIALWVSATEVQVAVDSEANPIPPAIGAAGSASFDNALVEQDDTFVIATLDDVQEAAGQGTNGPAIKGDPGNNSTAVPFGDVAPEPPAPGFRTGHDIRFYPGPLQLQDFYGLDDGSMATGGGVLSSHDVGDPSGGGGGRLILPGTDLARHQNGAAVDNIGTVSRGQVLTVGAFATIRADAPGRDFAIHQCIALDTAHYELTNLPASLAVRETTNDGSVQGGTIGYSSRPPSDGVVHVTQGDMLSTFVYRPWALGAGGLNPGWPYVVEVANAGNPVSAVTGGTGIDEDGLTCDGGLGWVDARGDLSAFDPNGDGNYEGITRIRVRSTEVTNTAVSDITEDADGRWEATGQQAYFNVRVKQDLNVNTNNQELFVFTAHSYSEEGWDGSGIVPMANDNKCARYGGQWSLDDPTGDGDLAPSGWCSNRFHDDGIDSFDTADLVDWHDATRGHTDVGSGTTQASASMVRIAGAKLGIEKENLDGAGDIKDNGQLVQFKISPSVTGASVEALTNIRVIDYLPPEYIFQRFVDFPDVPHVCTQAGQQVTCQYSDPAAPFDGADPDGLPAGLAGGWPLSTGLDASFTIEVMVWGAISSPDNPTVLTNRARGRSDGLGPWDPGAGFSADPVSAPSDVNAYASSFMPLPADEGLIIKAQDTFAGDCVAYPDAPIDAASLDPQPVDWADRCEMIDFADASVSGAGDMSFTLSFTNEGNTAFTNIRFVDVFPHNGDEVEPASNTNNQDGSPQTLGDGRSPESDFAGTLAFASLSNAATVWVTGDPSLSISRDPDAALIGTTWCDTISGAVQNLGNTGSGSCPTTAEAVTATYSVSAGPLNPGQTLTHRITLDSSGAECDDIWTNTFGARVDELFLPIRSNDVSIMVNCEYDQALRKTVDPAWVPDGAWLTPGVSTVDFVIEVHNQGDPINNLEVTDYIDSSMFTFDIGLNGGGNTTDALALPFTWDNSGANPVVSINDPAHPLHNTSSNLIPQASVLLIPVTLTVAPGFTGTSLDNVAEISYFDNDADPSNGDSASGDVVDVDSLPDASDGDALVDDELDSDITQGGADEDDHDIALVPVFDLAIDKANPTMNQVGAGWQATFDIIVTNEGNQDVFLVDVLETPPAGLTFNSFSGGADVSQTVAPNEFQIDALPVGASTTFTVVYDVTDLTAGPYTNSVQIADFDNDDIADNAEPEWVQDIDSATNAGPDGGGADDGDHTQRNEDDDDVETVSLPFDLALVKKPVVNDPAFPDILNGVQNGDQILFEIEVFNQLSQVEDFDIIDYLQAGWVFDPAVQVSPLFTQPGSGANGGPSLPFTWTTSGADPVAAVDGVLPAGESVIIPIVLTADIPNNPLAVLENFAEILRFDDDGDPTNGDSTDGTVTDIDSTPDGSNTDTLIDDEFNDDGTNDEDDHDGASTVWYDVALDKRIEDGAACVDGPAAITAATTTVTYCIVVRNQGPTTLYNVGFADTPPAGLTYASDTGPATVTSNGDGTFVIPSLAPGISETVRVTYDVSVGDIVSGSLDNVAEVTEMYSDEAGTDPAEDVDSFVDETPDADAPNEDDEDLESLTIPYDLALTKTLGPIADGQVTMFLTIENQSIAVETVDITDYIDASMWDPFSTGLNPAGATTTSGGTAMGFFWDGSDPLNPVATISPNVAGDKLGFGDTVVIPIVLTISADWVGPELVNTAEISNFDDDGDDTNGDASDGTLVDGDSTPDDTDGNGPGESFNSVDDDTSGDPADGGDEDDHDGVLIPVFDLALKKVLDPATTQPVSPGDLVTFFIEVTNQGNTHATNPTLVDYVDLAMFDAFDTADGANAGGSTAGDQALPYAWTTAGSDGSVAITGTLAPGETVIVPVTLTVAAAPTATTLTNTAEITGGTATDDGGTEITDGNGDPLTDLDSTPDDDNTDTTVDDVTDGTGGDEDDHDIADVVVAVPAIDIEKDTNGVQSDVAPGERLMAGDPVTWNYDVTNTGTTALLDAVVTDSMGEAVDCDPTSQVSATIPLLLPGETVSCTATGTVGLGDYANTADVSGTPAWPSDPSADPTDSDSWSDDPADFAPTGQADVIDDDPSHYYGTDGGLELEKATNGIDADEAPGVPLAVGDSVVWTYEVTNTSPAAMLAVTVTDSDPTVVIDCGAGTNVIAVLLPGQTITCTSVGAVLAAAGDYHNDSSVTGDAALPTDPELADDDPSTWPDDPAAYASTGEEPYTDEDPSNLFALEGGLDLEKSTNGVDSDAAPGEQILAGDDVTWTYAVTNTSNAVMTAVTVNDSDPSINVDCGSGSNQIAVLAVGETVTCTATGTAGLGDYTNDSSVSGTPSVEDPDNPGSYIPTGHPPATDEDPSNYTGANPAIHIEKSTNGDDADATSGPFLAPGAPVTWTYVVTNTGNIALIDAEVNDNDPAVTVECPAGSGTNVIGLLGLGASVTCEATGTAELGSYENIADVSGTPAQLTDPAADPDDPASYEPSGLDPVVDDDPSHYVAADGGIELEKSTNGVDADTVTGPIVSPGDPVLWTYVVTNTSDSPVVDLVVTDDQGEAVDCGDGGNSIAVLLPGESFTCTATGVAGDGQYTNTGSVTGTPGAEDPDNPGEYNPVPGAPPVGDSDPSHYTGLVPAIDIEKDTNGDDADATVGPFLAPGDAVTWTYVVTNTGEVALTDVTVGDNDPAVSVECPAGSGTNVIALMQVGDTVTCEATGTAELGAYENISDVSGTPAQVDPNNPDADPSDPASYVATGQDDVTDDDPSHYVAADGEVMIIKATNGFDANTAPGVVINEGDPVTWTYTVLNSSDTPLVDLVVTDDQGEAVDCGDGSNQVASLMPGASHVCTATGVAGDGQYTNIGAVTGQPAAPGPDGELAPIPGTDPVGDDDPSNYLGATPAIDIEKDTNGDQADTTAGPVLAPGDAVTWTYVVTNTGDVDLINATVTDSQGEAVVCPSGTNVIALLLVGESVTCEATGVAQLGTYENIADVSGTPVQLSDPDADPTDPANYTPTGQDDVSDDDPSHYVAHDGAILLEKDTNGEDADVATGPTIDVGGDVTWTYAVTNTSATTLIDVLVTDDQGEAVDCGAGNNTIADLAPGATHYCTATGTAGSGQYSNLGSVVGTPAMPDPANGGFAPIPGAEPATDEDPSHYIGADPSIDIEKSTNGEDADTAFGPVLSPGDPVVWTYLVTNDGDVALTDVTITDSQGETVVCPSGDNTIALLVPGQSVTCEATGTAELGAYENIADVSGTPAQLDDPDADPTDPANYEPTGQDPVTDDDPSHYVASDGDIVLEKSTNDVDADTPTGPTIDVGGDVTWTYTVGNISATPLMNVTVTDDQGEAVDCGDGSSTIAVLLPGETHECTATGIAGDGQYSNLGSVTGQPAQEDPDNPGSYNALPGVDPVTDEDPSHYIGADPAIDIEKDTNGDQADDTLGPILAPGDDVTWTYVVTNTGDVALADATVTDSQGEAVDCGDGTATIALLAPGDSVTCTATGVATVGLYANNSTVSGNPVALTPAALADPTADPTDPANYAPTGQPDVSDEDPSHYVGAEGDLSLEKATNGFDADVVTGPVLNPGDDVTWTYVVLNTSDTPLVNVAVTDDQGEFVDCGNGSNTIAVLLPGTQHLCTATGTASAGQYGNIGEVVGQPAAEDPDNPGSYLAVPGADPATDTDPSHYVAAVPAIDIEKDTNGDQADTTMGPVLAPGYDVTWTYVVTNTGDVDLINATVTDSQGEAVVCPSGDNTIALLLVGESVTCEATGVAELGTYENVADVSGTPAQVDPNNPTADPTDPASYVATGQDDVTDDDPSHYVAIEPSVNIEKSTNGEDADVAPGPFVTPGGPVTWTYVVTNDGTTPLVGLDVTDDKGVVVDCGDGTNTIASLMPGDSATCTGNGAGADGQYENLGSVSGQPAVEGPDGELVPVVGADPVTDTDPSHHLGALPSINLEKATNGDDADFTQGPLLGIGDTVTWTYVVTNDGDTALTGATVTDDDPSVSIDCGDGTNTIALLVPGASATCTATGTAELGEYENTASVTGTPAGPVDPAADCCDPADSASWPTDAALYEPTGQADVDDTDLSHYVAHGGSIDIEKSTNGYDADEVTGPVIAPGDPVNWRYVVTNTSDTPLVDLTVSDDQGEPVDCGDGGSSIALLLPGESFACTATGIATAGQYTNIGSVVGTPGQPDPANPGNYLAIPGAETVTDEDPSHYIGAVPAIDIEKDTNGVQSDTAPGEQILEATPVVWTYAVTNTGDVDLIDAIVTDSQGVAVDCGDGTNTIALLAVGDTVTCTGNGVAGETDYANNGIVSGTPAFEDPANPGEYLPIPGATDVVDIDASHYDGVPLEFDLALQKKLVSSVKGLPSSHVFAIKVINQGTVTAVDMTIVDHFPEDMTLDDDDWTDNGDGTASYQLAGPLAPGESVTIDIEVKFNNFGKAINTAGIEAASPVHPDTGAALDITDIDSILGDSSLDSVVDNELDNKGGDEDDSDIAEIDNKPDDPGGQIVPSFTPPTVSFTPGRTTQTTNPPRTVPFTTTNQQPNPRLAFTGAQSKQLAIFGAVILVTGMALVVATRGRRKEDEGIELEWERLDD